jgi:phosphopantothenoylcysteine decarboxylase/phosphopantothenate--cysteine ligase
VIVVDPIAGRVACGEEGVGHIASDDTIRMAIESSRPYAQTLSGKKVLMTAGPMRTIIDPVRYLQNRSSGVMGLELAKACVGRGASELRVILGPVDSSLHMQFPQSQIYTYQTPSEYESLLFEHFEHCDLFFSAAAVLDFEVIPQTQKLSRSELKETLELRIKPVEDYVRRAVKLKKPHQKVIAFAAEVGTDQEILSRARFKLQSKGADYLVINRVSDKSGPDQPQSEVWLMDSHGHSHFYGSQPKTLIWNLIFEDLHIR